MSGENEELRLHARDGSRQATVTFKTPGSTRELQCDENAENAVFTAITLKAHSISREKSTLEVSSINFRTRATDLLLRAELKHVLPMALASPDGRYIAYRPELIDILQQAPSAKLIAVMGDSALWKSDSSMLLSTSGPPMTAQTIPAEYAMSIEVIYADTGRRISGSLPRGYLLQHLQRNASFVDRGGAILLLMSASDRMKRAEPSSDAPCRRSNAAN
jgi:hypothetical protein